MKDTQLTAKLRDLRELQTETEWVEFKKDNTNPQQIGECLSALSNSAALQFQPRKAKGKGNEDLEPWLARMLSPRVEIAMHEFAAEGMPVVLFEVQAANTAPVAFAGVEHVRVGSHTKPLRDYPEKERALWAGFSASDFEAGAALSGADAADVVALLDYESYFRLMQVRVPDTRAKIVERLGDDGLVRRDGKTFDICNMGAILFARDLTRFGRLGRKAVRVIKYSAAGRVRTEREWNDPPARSGYASGFEATIAFINSQLPQNEHISEGLRERGRAYPDIAIRELVANALIHQDFTVTGAGPMVEIFGDRVEITNPGEPLVDPRRFIDTPPRSRNEVLAGMMRRLNICEERGSGIDKVIFAIEMFQMPPPDFRVPPGSTQVLLFAPQTFAAMDRAERVRACYQHCVLCWVENKVMANSSLRQRFGIADENYSMASRVIRDTLNEGLIVRKNADVSAKKYVPYWA